MENRVVHIVSLALDKLKAEGFLPADFAPAIAIERPKREEFGDFGCALPLAMTRVARKAPAECAKRLIEAMDVPQDVFARVDFAPPGYVNFTVRPDAWFARLANIAADPANYGASDAGRNERILIEFVSANPTGPLHVGHCRGAVTGDALGRILKAAGWDAVTEYYINDVGNQMGMLGLSMHARGREVLGLPVEFPEKGYHGDYVRDLAAEFVATPEGRAFCETAEYDVLGAPDDNAATRFASSRLLERIRQDLDALDVRFDGWFSERTLHQAGLIQAAVDDLIARDAAYRDEAGAILFRMTGEDDDQDRVIVRANGIPTYFAADIAYHHEKAQRANAAGRRFDRVVNIWGADHHGYIPRMRASLAALGHDPDLLEVLLVQMVTLTRAGVVVPLSKRSGQFVTLREVVDEVGRDAVRFLFLLRKGDAQMEFDLALAKSQTMENPVYYVQYGHARVASILRKARGLGHEAPPFSPDLGSVLSLPEEQALVRQLCQLPGVIESAARRREPHHVAFYLMELVKGFHAYYTRNKHSEKVVSDDARKTAARLFLVSRIKEVLARGLGLLGVSAPEEMYLGGEDAGTV